MALNRLDRAAPIWSSILMFVAVVLVVCALYAILSGLIGSSPRFVQRPLGVGHAFDSTGTMLDRDFDTGYTTASKLVESERRTATVYDGWQSGLSWAAFFITSLITLLGAVWGRQTGGANPTGDRPTGGMGICLALLAALATISTGAAQKVKSTADQQYNSAVELSSALASLRTRWVKPDRTAEESAAIINDLNAAILKQR